MLISLNWIKDFTSLSPELSPREIGLRLTMGTAEVENIREIGQFWEKIIVVEMTAIEPHPQADKLNLVTFKAGEGESFQVVCGAGNVRLGLKVPFAPVGTTLPAGFTLEAKKIRGILSEGMLCSEEELGLAPKSEGLMELPEDAPLGLSLKDYWEKTKDILYDIDNKSLTHRPDLWGHYGMAREFAALFGSELKNPFDESWSAQLEKDFNHELPPLKVEVKEDSAALAYFGLSLRKVQVGESPLLIKERLLAVGLRPINNIVDISNYVMLELGLPLHIFDRQKIEGDKIIVRTMGQEGEFTTLDEVQRKLLPRDTVICDEHKPLVIGGLMGGLNSGVDETTTDIFIEVANWKSSEVRKTSTRLGLRTDSSIRYEKTLDSHLCYRTLLRTYEMIKKVCPHVEVCGAVQYDGRDFQKEEPLVIKISMEEICSTLGKEISTKKIVEILSALDFQVHKKESRLEVRVPSYRSTKDIQCRADIIEEVGRIIGYDNITPKGPLLEVRPVRLNLFQSLRRKAQDFLSLHSQALEVTSYPMVGEKLLQKAQWESADQEKLEVMNSLSRDHSCMRDSLIPSFLEMAALNAKNEERFRFFEVGRIYCPDKELFAKERDLLGVCFYSKEETPFLELINEMTNLFSALGLSAQSVPPHPKFKNSLVDENWSGLHPQEFLNIRIRGQMKGAILSVHPLLLRSFKIKGHLSMAFVDLSFCSEYPLKEKTQYRPLSKFPESRFDFTLSLEKERSVSDIFDVLKKMKIRDLKEIKVVDVYCPPKSKEKYVTMRTLFHNSERTLSGETIKSYEQSVVSSLEKASLSLKARD